MRYWLRGLFAVGVLMFHCGTGFGDKPASKFWRGRLDEPRKSTGFSTAVPAANPKSAPSGKSEPRPQDAAAPKTSREPEWLQRMDKNERTTLTGGWGLQNLSGGSSSFTTAGDHGGPYAPNTYQGGQFQSWNNVSNRDDLPNWNGPTPGFPAELWSQGSMSPNSYFGPEAQVWGNMSAGGQSPNMLGGGWSTSPW